MFSRIATVLGAFFLAACSTGDPNSDPAGPSTPNPSSISLAATVVHLSALGERYQMVGTVNDQFGNPMPDLTLQWTADDSTVAEISEKGEITAVSNGSAAVIATSGPLSARASVHVAQTPSSISLSADSIRFTLIGDTVSLSAVVFDSRGNGIQDADISWISSDTLIGKVSSLGLVTAVGHGVASVSGEVDTLSASAEVIIPRIMEPYELCEENHPFDIPTFADSALSKLVNETLVELGGLEILGDSGPSCKALKILNQTLRARKRGISNLQGIQNLTELRGAVFTLNEIRSLTPLTSLGMLEHLDLGNNAISDLPPMDGLAFLEDLNLVGNSIQDITPLSSLVHLARLSVGDNPITDLSSLGALSQLIVLDIHKNQLIDDPYDRDGITDIRPLGQLEKLQHLDLLGNAAIADISPLVGLENLLSLSLGIGNSARPGQLGDLGPLSELNNLEYLRIEGSSSDLDITPLGNLIQLETLWLRSNGISDISILKNLINLSTIHLSSNSISSVAALKTLAGVRMLGLAQNEISDIDPLRDLTKLEWLALGTNSIRNVGVLAGMVNLDYLDLSRNRELVSIESLLSNPGLAEGDEVNLTESGVSCSDVELLRARGVEVISGC